jgi:hypothetical protein
VNTPSRLLLTASFLFVGTGAIAAPVTINTSNASNGWTDLYSATFDGGLVGCGGGSSAYCTFFGGDPAASRKITVAPNPSGVISAVPGGIGPTGTPVAPTPASGSFLDLTLGAGNTTLSLGVSSITFAPIHLCLTTTTPCDGLNINSVGAGVVFNAPGSALGGALTPAGGGSTGATVPVNGSRRAVFEVQNAGSVIVDFSRFSQVVTSCTGSFCALVSADVLNFDIVRYVLEVQYDPAFTSFTGNFIGETSNNSLIYATLNSEVVPVPAAFWLLGSALGVLAWARPRAC